MDNSTDPSVLTTQQLDKAIHGVEQLFSVKLEAMEQIFTVQFRLTEDRTAEQKSDTKEAIKAALDAVKEANAKTEASTERQLTALGLTFSTAIDSLRSAIDDLKGTAKQGGKDAYNGLVLLAGGILTLLGIGGIIFGTTR